jgi:F-type H+-transporting ATPase subunit alpha
MELQVISIFAATPPADRESWVRQVPLADVQRYESEMLEYVQQNHGEVVEAIRKQGKLEDATKGKLREALDAFARVFQATKAADAA